MYKTLQYRYRYRYHRTSSAIIINIYRGLGFLLFPGLGTLLPRLFLSHSIIRMSAVLFSWLIAPIAIIAPVTIIAMVTIVAPVTIIAPIPIVMAHRVVATIPIIAAGRGPVIPPIGIISAIISTISVIAATIISTVTPPVVPPGKENHRYSF